VALPIIPHADFGAADCCGCLVEIVEESGTKFVCNECGAVIPPEDVQRVVMTMESVEATCPHCGRVNQISGFSEVLAFTCRYCGRGVGL
jgi:predicted RNA-binding Zn-ribbon protein involved in translation (DUF1610 family)